MNAFDDAIAAADATILSVAGKTVSYRRGEAQVDWFCVVGKTLFESVDNSNTIIQFEARDYIGAAAGIVFDSEDGPTIPKQGDRIYEANGMVFEVLTPKGQNCFAYSDPEQTTVRIHTKYVGMSV